MKHQGLRLGIIAGIALLLMLTGSAATGESPRADVIINEIMTQSGEFTNGENDD